MTGSLRHKLISLPKLSTRVTSADRGQFNRDGLLYHDLWWLTRVEWDRTVRAYEASPGDFGNAWRYLSNHPAFWQLRPMQGWEKPVRHYRNLIDDYGFGGDAIRVSVRLVSPADGKLSGDPALNTQTVVALEAGEWSWHVNEATGVDLNTSCHDVRLDCRAGTYEKAVIKLARRVWKHYGNDRRRCSEHRARKQAKATAAAGRQITVETSAGPAEADQLNQDLQQGHYYGLTPRDYGEAPEIISSVRRLEKHREEPEVPAFGEMLRRWNVTTGQGARGHWSGWVLNAPDLSWPKPPCYWTPLGSRVHIRPSCRCPRSLR